jgi:serine/threonine protein kinase
VTLETGTRLGPYEIVAPLGAGGMGEVYRAADSRLGREVAIKVLPAALAADPDRLARFDREARLLAYASEQSGRWEVYVQALGGERGKWQISSEGGRRPRWRADGRELFFLSSPDRVMSVDVEPGEVPRFSAPRELFRHAIEDFDVTPDGRRFVARRPADGDVSKPLVVLTNWTRLLAAP